MFWATAIRKRLQVPMRQSRHARLLATPHLPQNLTFRDFRNFRNFQDVRDVRDFRDFGGFRDFRDFLGVAWFLKFPGFSWFPEFPGSLGSTLSQEGHQQDFHGFRDSQACPMIFRMQGLISIT